MSEAYFEPIPGAETRFLLGKRDHEEELATAGRVFLEGTRTLFGIAMVENGYDQLLHVELVARDRIFERDAALLEICLLYTSPSPRDA